MTEQEMRRELDMRLYAELSRPGFEKWAQSRWPSIDLTTEGLFAPYITGRVQAIFEAYLAGKKDATQ